MARTRRLLGAVFGLLVLPATAFAQWPMPDGLDGGPCCTVAQLQIPSFPTVVQDSMEICWLDCGVDQTIGCTARWRKPQPLPGQPTSCGRYFSRLTLSDAAGVNKWVGRVNLTYSRTWQETDAAGVPLQVWRFLTNTNLKVKTAAGPVPCPVPSCAAAFGGKVRCTGYIDYAIDCATGAVSIAWMLNHSCDVIDHAPGFPRAGVFHPRRAYTFVGPAAGFAPARIGPVAAGTTLLEAVRRVQLPMAVNDTLCEFEEQIQAAMQPIQQLCLCGPVGAPMQYVISNLTLASACGTGISTPGGPFLPGYIGMGIGSWGDPLTYPGVEFLRWNCGGYDYFDPCTASTRQEVFYGVTTVGGYFAEQINANGIGRPLPRTFVDQGNSLRRKNNKKTVMNVLFASDHIINLNFD